MIDNENSNGKSVVLVTGATGLAGSAVIREFVRRKHPVRALVRNRAKARSLEAIPSVEIVEGDMSRPESLTQALAGISTVLLISSANANMVETQKAFIDAAKAAGVGHVVKFSGLSAGDTDSSFVFATMHAEIERYLERSGLSWTHFRPSQFMTEYLRELPTIQGYDSLFLPFKDAKLVPVDLADIAKAAFVLLTTPGHEAKTYAMSGPEALNMHEVAAHISQAINKPIQYVNVSPEQRNQALLSAGVPAFFVDALDAQTRERWKGRESQVYSETHETLGITPSTFAQFVRRNAGAFLGESAYVGLS
jgi:uncharacterized protein YbjT (DUF2867 family)